MARSAQSLEVLQTDFTATIEAIEAHLELLKSRKISQDPTINSGTKKMLIAIQDEVQDGMRILKDANPRSDNPLHVNNGGSADAMTSAFANI